jgi:hypothetical protein
VPLLQLNIDAGKRLENARPAADDARVPQVGSDCDDTGDAPPEKAHQFLTPD